MNEIEVLERRAQISTCGKFRWMLYRRMKTATDEAAGRVILWLMLNPSIADAEIDDPTIKRVMAFSLLWGFGQVYVGNVFGYRATSPRVLQGIQDPVGFANRTYLKTMASFAEKTVCAWGAYHLAGDPYNVYAANAYVAAKSRNGMWCLGLTQNGSPRHPLYVKSDTALEAYHP